MYISILEVMSVNALPTSDMPLHGLKKVQIQKNFKLTTQAGMEKSIWVKIIILNFPQFFNFENDTISLQISKLPTKYNISWKETSQFPVFPGHRILSGALFFNSEETLSIQVRILPN